MTDYRALLTEIAVPRLTGSVPQARIIGSLKRELAARGFTTADHHFAATAAPLRAVALGGLAAACTGAAVLACGAAGQPPAETGRYVLGGIFLVLLVLATPLRRPLFDRIAGPTTRAINLIATRGPRPRVWLVAHYDSKGQLFSMAGRLVLVTATVAGSALLIGLMVTSLGGLVVAAGWWTAGAAAALLGGAALAFNAWLRESPGAVDNATGILTILAVLDRLPPEAAVGVLLPDAEERGLVGARAVVRDRPELFHGTSIVNFDGIDDRGSVVVLRHRRAGTAERSVTAAVSRSLGTTPWRWLPVVVDGAALAQAPYLEDCISIMRGDWRTMRIVHTRRDTADRLTLDGMREVAERVAEALRAAL